ncbi:unnamed protein product [Adineta steineri]|uniref:Acyl-CoA thioesterase II n=1 Tax=Adineta steineri TaxID=433720 RepID=A0A818TM45_9BILA|nr:unnamed protein product [Adineta steineri]CAF3685587.1 unnamed protein product [Adineta steineri]
MLLKRYSLLNTIIYRCLSSERPTLYESLKVHQTAPDVFTQPAESLFVYPYRTSVFGGQIIGSAMYAAHLTLTKDYPLHSLHSYFLAAADNSSPIIYTIKRLRDGKSFETRSVTARQDNKIIFECAMSFHKKEQGNMAHQPIMPKDNVVPPEQLQSTRHRFQNLLNDERLKPELRPFLELALDMPARIDIRHCHPRDLLRPTPKWPARQLIWIKTIDPLPNDSYLHRSAVAYCSDRVLLTSALLPYALNVFSPRIHMQASLDHTMWFHDDFSFDTTSQTDPPTEDDPPKPIRRHADIPSIPSKLPVRADDWLLYELECPIAMNNRALTFGKIWTRDGRLIVTCTQEGVIRCY